MQAELAREILETQPDGRLLFRYGRDAFAPELLSYVLDRPTRVADIKASRFGWLLARPVLEPVLASAGAGVVSAEDMLLCEVSEPQAYRLTLGRWGSSRKTYRYLQTSRPGTNLVLQLNFSTEHDNAYHSLVRPGRARPFSYFGHPVNQNGLNTLAWSRIDLDLTTGEALIEEVQTDWLRFAECSLVAAKRRGSLLLDGRKIPVERIERYVYRVLRPHKRLWDEAMLLAAIRFIREEIGLTEIYIHDHESGARLKSIDEDAPPRSLYTDLPRRFCFKRVAGVPRFLCESFGGRIKALLKDGPLHSWRIDVSKGAIG